MHVNTRALRCTYAKLVQTRETTSNKREREREKVYHERNCFCHAARSTFGLLSRTHDAITKLNTSPADSGKAAAACGADLIKG